MSAAFRVHVENKTLSPEELFLFLERLQHLIPPFLTPEAFCEHCRDVPALQLGGAETGAPPSQSGWSSLQSGTVNEASFVMLASDMDPLASLWDTLRALLEETADLHADWGTCWSVWASAEREAQFDECCAECDVYGGRWV